jgi:hypothetical protein
VVAEQPFGSSRISVFTKAGRFVRSQRVALPAGQAGPLAAVSAVDAEHLLVTRGGFRPFSPSANELWRRPIVLGAWSQSTLAFRHLADLPGANFISYAATASGGSVTASAIAALAPQPLYVAGRGVVVFGESSWDSLVVVRLATDERQVVRLPGGRARVDPTALRRSRDAALGQAVDRNDSARVMAVHSGPATPDLQPLFGQVLLGPRDELWVERFRFAHEPSLRFQVLSAASGRVLAEVALPAGFRAQQVGEDSILGTFLQTSGEESVARLGLRRGRP